MGILNEKRCKSNNLRGERKIKFYKIIRKKI